MKFIRLSNDSDFMLLCGVCIEGLVGPIHISYMRSSLAFVIFFIVKSERKRSPGTDFAAEDMKDTIRAILFYTAANFRISNRIE